MAKLELRVTEQKQTIEQLQRLADSDEALKKSTERSRKQADEAEADRVKLQELRGLVDIGKQAPMLAERSLTMPASRSHPCRIFSLRRISSRKRPSAACTSRKSGTQKKMHRRCAWRWMLPRRTTQPG